MWKALAPTPGGQDGEFDWAEAVRYRGPSLDERVEHLGRVQIAELRGMAQDLRIIRTLLGRLVESQEKANGQKSNQPT